VVTINQPTLIYQTASKAQPSTRTLPANTNWRAFTTTKAADGTVWYNLGGHQYVSAKDTTFRATTMPSLTATNRNVTIHYISGYGIALWRDNAGKQFAQRYLMTGSRWHVNQIARWANGQTFYQVGTNQWIDARYTK